MDKNQFLTLLKQSLSSEIPEREVDNNINFYKEYINSAVNDYKTEEDILEELGDPRLIARTIIDTYKRSKESVLEGFREQKGSEYQENNERKSNEGYSNGEGRHAVGKILTIILVVFIFLTFGKVLLAVTFSMVIPLLLLFFVVSIIFGIFRR